MNSIYEKLTELGIKVAEPKTKIDNSKVNIKIKIDNAQGFISNANKSVGLLNDASDKEDVYYYLDSVVLNYQRYCEAVKDILLRVSEENKIKLSENKSLSELLRKTEDIFDLNSETKKALSSLSDRNESVHDYINSGYYDEQVLKHIENYYDYYVLYVERIRDYCKKNNII